MAKYELKTKMNDEDVLEFLHSIENENRRTDSLKLLGIMKDLTGEEPRMWGKSIVGFGTYSFKYASGHEGEWMTIGFSPRKQSLTLYIMPGFKRYKSLMEKLGKYKTGKSCLYINRLEDVEIDVLRDLILSSYQHNS